MDAVAQSLADPVRREILRMLRLRPRSAGAIAEAFAISRPAISRHLRVLREAGLVSDHADGRQREYRIELESLRDLETFLSDLRAGRDVWQHRFDALETEVHRVRRRNDQTRRRPATTKRKASA